MLDVGIYTRRIKSRILYNHLLVSGTPKQNIRALIDSNYLASIIDHPNYNPRVIEVMTDIFHIGEIEPAAYPEVFLDALKNPQQIWDKAFRTHIDHRCRHLLITMFFDSEFGVSINDLRIAFDSLHGNMSSTYGLPFGPKDFEESIRILEGSFISIRGKTASFVNPSLRDYLSSYLSDLDLLCRIAPTAKSVDWIHSLWGFVERNFQIDPQKEKLAESCVDLIEMFERQPIWRQTSSNPISMEYNDAPNATRIELLLDWWQLTNDGRFADCIMRIVKNPKGGFSTWKDSITFVKFLTRLPDRKYGRKFLYQDEFLSLIEKALVDLIWSASSDDLSSIYDAVDEAGAVIPESILKGLEGAIRDEFSEIERRVQDEESESELNDRIELLKKFAPRYNIPDKELTAAVLVVEDRISQIQEESSPSSSPQFSSDPQSERKSDDFDDTDLRNLFIPLLEE